MTFLQDAVEKSGIEVTPVTEGVLRLDVDSERLTLCVVEYCKEQQYLSRERAVQHPTCYVAVSPRDFDDRFLKEDWVCRARLADMICGHTDLGKLVHETAAKAPPQSLANASIPVCDRGPSNVIVQTAPQRISDRRFVVEVGNGIVRIEGVKVIAEQAGPRFVLFRTLWLWFLDDLRSELPPEQFQAWPLGKLIEELESQTDKKYPDETSVRRIINNMQTDIEQRLRRELGLPVDRHDIVETRPWSGQGNNSYGYRINPFSVVARPFRRNLS